MASNKKRIGEIQGKKKLTGKNVLVGYELQTGTLVFMDPHHVLIVGITRKAGKTTAAEGISNRFPGVKVVAFTTKRGEDVFANGFNSLPVFFKEPDPPLWRYLENMFAATLETKQLGIIRTTLIEFTKTTRTLDDAWKAVKKGLDTGKLPDGRKLSAFDRSMLVQIDAYFDIAMPQLKAIKFVDKLALKPGVNVMSLIGYKQEVQAMIIHAVCEEIRQRDQDTLTIIPEAWKFVPSGRMSPAKLAIESLMREGLVLRNYVMLDSQSLKVDPTIRQLCDNYLIGKLGREGNEVDRAMEVLEGFGIKPTDIKNQKVGQFYVLSNDVVKHVYVLPAWMSEEDAQAVAKDYSTLPAVAKKYGIEISASAEEIEITTGSQVALHARPSGEPDQKVMKELTDLRVLYENIAKEKDGLEVTVNEQRSTIESQSIALSEARQEVQKAATFRIALTEFLSGSGAMKVESSLPVPATVEQTRSVPSKNPKTVSEWLEKLWQDGFFTQERSLQDIMNEIKQNGFNFKNSVIGTQLLERVRRGHLTRKGSAGNFKYIQKRPYH